MIYIEHKPNKALESVRAHHKLRLETGSSPAEGSSSITTSGLPMMAIATHCIVKNAENKKMKCK